MPDLYDKVWNLSCALKKGKAYVDLDVKKAWGSISETSWNENKPNLSCPN